jgi:hypothetical protein
MIHDSGFKTIGGALASKNQTANAFWNLSHLNAEA